MTKGNYSDNAFPQPTTKRRVDREGADFYPTPEWATFALTEVETFVGDIYEPACGDGRMSDILIARTGLPVYSSDLYDRGYGDPGVDFLTSTRHATNIITNPPYNVAEEFLTKALELASRKVALLVRLAFAVGQGRYKNVYCRTPPTRIWGFSERITFWPHSLTPPNNEKRGTGTTEYAWFVFEKGSIRTDGMSDYGWIKPGCKDRYHLWLDSIED